MYHKMVDQEITDIELIDNRIEDENSVIFKNINQDLIDGLTVEDIENLVIFLAQLKMNKIIFSILLLVLSINTFSQQLSKQEKIEKL